MARFFFDVVDGDDAFEDAEGVELPDVQAARNTAVNALHELTRSLLRGYDNRTVVIRVRTADGMPVLAVGLMATVRYGE
ncbi:DUF6894 family protein [Salinarimonas soli]|uniref:DUF6894 domain-containing protein n=1 Tax=Salinarimonas soli TaxID=1638099 RepID=A0A5B2W091_9HYPH|nr:hypothetical protein [Salinarimonas soli]KAA2244338.1 hypothetical protein F0L46_00115 [Salinarimonas soli]